MGKIEKLYGKFSKKPVPNDITFKEVVTLFEHFGCKIVYGGKHPKVIHIRSGTIITVPRHKKSVDEVYVKQLKCLLEVLLEEEKR